MSEKIFGVIKLIRTSFLRATIYEILFFTPGRVIVARICVTGAEAVYTNHWFTLIAGIIIQLFVGEYKARKAKEKETEYLALSPEDILKADKRNYVIPNPEITKVELSYYQSKFGKPSPREIKITTGKRKRKWHIYVEKEDRTLEDYESILQPIFGDKFSTTSQPIEVKPVLTWNIAHVFVTLLAFAVWLGVIIFMGLLGFQRWGYFGGDWYMFSLIWTIFIGLPMSMVYGWLVGSSLSRRLWMSMLVWIGFHITMLFLDIFMDLQWLSLVVPIACSLIFYALWEKRTRAHNL